jgi:hypothetical protein
MGRNIPFNAHVPRKKPEPVRKKPEPVKPLPHSEIEWDVTPLGDGKKVGHMGQKPDIIYRLFGSWPKQPNTG